MIHGKWKMGQLDIFDKFWWNPDTVADVPVPGLSETSSIREMATTPPIEIYPWASSPNAAAHIHFFLLDPQGFANAVQANYNALSTQEERAAYAADIGGFLTELNNVNSPLLHEKFSLMSTNSLGFMTTLWPPITNWFWVTWASRDMNGFLTAHLGNISAVPPEQWPAHAIQLQTLWDVHFPDFDFRTLSKETAVKWLQIVEPEKYEELKIAQAGLDAKQQMTKFMGFAILGVFGLWGVGKLMEGRG